MVQTTLVCGKHSTTMQIRNCFKILILQETSKTQSQHHVDSFACWEVKQLCEPVGCARNRHQSHTAQQKLIFLLMQVYRMDGIPALDLWDTVIEVFHSSPNQINKSKDQESQGNLSRNTTIHMNNQNSTKHVDLNLSSVDHVSSNVRPSRFGAV